MSLRVNPISCVCGSNRESKCVPSLCGLWCHTHCCDVWGLGSTHGWAQTEQRGWWGVHWCQCLCQTLAESWALIIEAFYNVSRWYTSSVMGRGERRRQRGTVREREREGDLSWLFTSLSSCWQITQAPPWRMVRDGCNYRWHKHTCTRSQLRFFSPNKNKAALR